MHKKAAFLFLALALVLPLMLTGCPSIMGGEVQSFADMSPKQKAVFVMDIYNKQYDSYLDLYRKGEWTDAEKKTLQVKYDLLQELHPYIEMFNSYAEKGVMPPADVEQALISVVNKLISM